MRLATFDIILDQLKRKRDQELTILIEKQKQEDLQSKLVAKNREINDLKRTKAGFQKYILTRYWKKPEWGRVFGVKAVFWKPWKKKLTEYRCEQLLRRVLELERLTVSQEKVIFENVVKKNKINERMKEKQIQLKALLVVLTSTLLVAAVLLKVIFYLLE